MNELRVLCVSVRDYFSPAPLFFPFGLLPAMSGGAGAPRTLNTVELSHGESARPEKDS